jgi:hypothetical protein
MEASCPRRKPNHRKPVSWWSPELSHQRQESNKKYREWKRDPGNERKELEYRSVNEDYKRMILETKESSWREFCTNANKHDAASDLARAVKRGGNKQKAWLAGATDEDDHLKRLLLHHFPGIETEGNGAEERERADGCRAAAIKVTAEMIKETMASFGAYKAAGPDGVRPIMLQNLPGNALSLLAEIYTESLSTGTIPAIWQANVRGVYPQGREGSDCAKGLQTDYS